jgi:hypothetical protein
MYEPDPDNAGVGIGVMEFNYTVTTPAYSCLTKNNLKN